MTASAAIGLAVLNTALVGGFAVVTVMGGFWLLTGKAELRAGYDRGAIGRQCRHYLAFRHRCSVGGGYLGICVVAEQARANKLHQSRRRRPP